MRGRRCHFHLLAGQLAVQNTLLTYRPSRMPLAESLVSLLPEKARAFTDGHKELSTTRGGSNPRTIQYRRRSQRSGQLLNWCAENISDEGPEWAGQFALAESEYLRAIGHADDAVDRLQSVLERIGDQTGRYTRYRSPQIISRSRAVTAAMSAQPVARWAISSVRRGDNVYPAYEHLQASFRAELSFGGGCPRG